MPLATGWDWSPETRMDSALLDRIKAHEGFRRHAYKCSEGYLTIGYGLNIDHNGWGLDEDLAQEALKRALLVLEDRLMETDWYGSLDPVRAGVALEMAYQMGLQGLLKFRRTIEAIRWENWDQAATEMLRSRWAEQTPERAERLAEIMRTGQD